MKSNLQQRSSEEELVSFLKPSVVSSVPAEMFPRNISDVYKGNVFFFKENYFSILRYRITPPNFSPPAPAPAPPRGVESPPCEANSIARYYIPVQHEVAGLWDANLSFPSRGLLEQEWEFTKRAGLLLMQLSNYPTPVPSVDFVQVRLLCCGLVCEKRGRLTGILHRAMC
jgi:hypothetical protein